MPVGSRLRNTELFGQGLEADGFRPPALGFPERGVVIWSLAFHPTRPEVMYAGSAPFALYRSVDGGDNWKKIDSAVSMEHCPMAFPTRAIGIAVVELGGGRMRASDAIDHAVGFTSLAGLGANVGPDAPLAMAHAKSDAAAARAETAIRAAYMLGRPLSGAELVYARIG